MTRSKKHPRYKLHAERAASRGEDAIGVAAIAYDYGATDAQARAIARRLCGYDVPEHVKLGTLINTTKENR